MAPEKLLRLTPSLSLKEQRLHERLGGRPAALGLLEIAEDARLLGSLELSGVPASWEEVRKRRVGAPVSADVAALGRALAAVAPSAGLDALALMAWHSALFPEEPGYRRSPRAREGAPPGAPPEFIESRLALLADWLGADSGRELKPLERAALGMARIVEILPFEDGNGRVSRLAASHVMAQG